MRTAENLLHLAFHLSRLRTKMYNTSNHSLCVSNRTIKTRIYHKMKILQLHLKYILIFCSTISLKGVMKGEGIKGIFITFLGV